MKSERRHELERNVLADWLKEAIDTVKPYTTAIAAAILLVLVASLTITWWSSRASAESGAAWDAFSTALDSRSVAELDRIAETHPKSRVGQWAALTAGELLLREGCDTLFSSKASANQQLRRATDNFIGVLDQSSDRGLLERATFELARAREAQNQLPQAIEKYEQVVKEWGGGTFAPLAQQRLDDLKRKSSKVFYDEFAKYDPKPAYSDNPGKGPAFDASALPDNPSVRPGPAKADDKGAGDVKLPDLGGKLDAAKDTGKAAESKPESKGSPATPPKK
jgi:predicted negative regulator of RcsB-dependent stress response